MAIYVDTLRACVPNRRWRWNEACHLFSDPGDLHALHEFAESIGLQRAWFQSAVMPHYDLTRVLREEALRAGAVHATLRETGEMIRTWRAFLTVSDAEK